MGIMNILLSEDSFRRTLDNITKNYSEPNFTLFSVIKIAEFSINGVNYGAYIKCIVHCKGEIDYCFNIYACCDEEEITSPEGYEIENYRNVSETYKAALQLAQKQFEKR